MEKNNSLERDRVLAVLQREIRPANVLRASGGDEGERECDIEGELHYGLAVVREVITIRRSTSDVRNG